MPIRENETFLDAFLADTPEEAEKVLAEHQQTLKALAIKAASFTGIDDDDLYEEGIIGLARAVRDFDEERSENFRIFAIYKIKDAIREFITRQAGNVRAPQYTQDAIRLANILREKLVKAGEYQYNALSDMWMSSLKYEGTTPLEKSIREVRTSLQNLADRSHTSVIQLLDRAEMIPSFVDGTAEISLVDMADTEKVEDKMINRIAVQEMLDKVKQYISEKEYELLYNRYVEGWTLRELAPKMGISAPHVNDLTQKALAKLKKLDLESEAM